MNPHPAIFYHMRKEIRRIFTESIDAGVTGITVTAAKACPHPDTACFSIHFAKHCTTMTEENNLYSLGCHIQHKHCFFYAFTWFASTYHRNNSLPHLLWPTPPTTHALRKNTYHANGPTGDRFYRCCWTRAYYYCGVVLRQTTCLVLNRTRGDSIFIILR